MKNYIEKMGMTEYLLLLDKLDSFKNSGPKIEFLSALPIKIVSDFLSNDLFPYLKKNPKKISKFRKFLPKNMDYWLTTQIPTGPIHDLDKLPSKKPKFGKPFVSDLFPLDIVAELFEFGVEYPHEFLDLVFGIVGGGRYEYFYMENHNAWRNIIWTPKMIEVYISGQKKSPFRKVYKLNLSQVGVLGMHNLLDKSKLNHLENDYPNLMYLNLSSNMDIKNIGKIEKFKKLKALLLMNTNLENIPQLNIFTKIKLLDLSQSTRTKLDGIGIFKNLNKLRIRSYNSRRISVVKRININKLEELKNHLKRLDLRSNYLYNIDGIEKLINLTHLNMNLNQIRNIDRLRELTKLEYLNLGNNRIINIEGLKKLTNLKELYLRGNQITKIEGLYNLINLKILDLGFNEIESIYMIYKLNNLEKLNIGYNLIKKLDGLDKLPKLKVLSINRAIAWNYRKIDDLKEKGVIIIRM